MIQLLGSFWGQPASAMKPGTLAVGGTPYTPDRSASLSRMPVAASALWSGFGACASPLSVTSAANSAPQMAYSFRFILSLLVSSLDYCVLTILSRRGGSSGVSDVLLMAQENRPNYTAGDILH